MADVITRFKLETTQFDSKLRDTAKALKDVTHQASLGGKDFDNFSKKAIESARALGTVQSGANNTKDKLRDLVGSYNDAAKAYNELTDKAKQGEFGKAMSQSLTQLQQRIKQTKEELYSMGDAVKGGGGGLFGGGKLDGMLQVFGGNVMTKIAGAGLNFASELGDMVKQGIELARAGEGIRIAFERLGRGDILDGLRKATHGTVTDLELMKAAVKFNDFKLPLDELGTMLAFAQQKAKDTGQSVDYMVDSIVTGLGRKSLMILDNLGLSAAEVKEKMAETGDMTKAVGAIIREQMAKAGDYVETAADRATQANVELENAMTRLGETFQPLSDSANSMWTSIKVGALDLLNNVIKPLIEKFTELGRMRAVYEGQSGDVRVNRQLDRLKGIQTDSYRQGTYKAQLRNYDTQIASHEQYLKDYKAWQSDKSNVGAYDRMQAFQKQTGLEWVSDVQAHLDAFKKMRAEYVQGAKAIISPIKTNIDTDDAEQNVASLTKKLKELQSQRKKAIAAGDTDLSKNLQKQINQVKADIKGLGGGTTTTTHQTREQRAQESFTKAEQNVASLTKKLKELQSQRKKAIAAGDTDLSKNLQKQINQVKADIKGLGGGTTTTTHQTREQRAQESFTKAEQNYKQALEQAAMELEAGTITRAEAKKKEMQAAEQRWKAIGDARNISDSPELKQAQDEAAANYKALAAEVKQMDDAIKAAKIKWETGESGFNTETMNAWMKGRQGDLQHANYGTEAYNNIAENIADMTTIKTIIEQRLKAGMEAADTDGIMEQLWERVFDGENIPDEVWQSLIDKINEKLKKLGLDTIKIDFTTGETSKKGRGREKKNPYLQYNEEGTTTASLNGVMGGIANGMNQMVSGMESLGVEIPEGIKGAINAIQGVSTILTGIATTVLAIEALSTANLFKLFSHGGVVHAANGYVDGNTYSGDQIPAMLNAGEVVLNRSQAGVLAASLQAVGQSGEGGGDGKPYVSGEMIWLGLTNYLNRSGRGEIVTSKRR